MNVVLTRTKLRVIFSRNVWHSYPDYLHYVQNLSRGFVSVGTLERYFSYRIVLISRARYHSHCKTHKRKQIALGHPVKVPFSGPTPQGLIFTPINREKATRLRRV